jgi:hypothetical protein
LSLTRTSGVFASQTALDRCISIVVLALVAQPVERVIEVLRRGIWMNQAFIRVRNDTNGSRTRFHAAHPQCRKRRLSAIHRACFHLFVSVSSRRLDSESGSRTRCGNLIHEQRQDARRGANEWRTRVYCRIVVRLLKQQSISFIEC